MRITLFIALFCLPAWMFGQNTSVVPIFNGKNLDGFEFHLVDPSLTLADVWWVEDGLLKCKGEPMGYLATQLEYTHFKLVVEWRWAPGKPAGNSGVLLRITGDPQALPRCFEAQLKHGNVGDIYGFHGNTVMGPADRSTSRESELTGKMTGVSKMVDAEDEAGDWNRYEIFLLDSSLTVFVNGVKVNEAWNLDVHPGKIGFQSEGGEIQFRKIDLIPVK